MLELMLQASDGFILIVQIGKDNVHIVDSYRIKDNAEKMSLIRTIRVHAFDVWAKRTDESLVAEWKAHNALYKRKKWTSHTKDVDLESNQSLFHKIAWFIVNLIYKE